MAPKTGWWEILDSLISMLTSKEDTIAQPAKFKSIPSWSIKPTANPFFLIQETQETQCSEYIGQETWCVLVYLSCMCSD